MKFGIDIGHNCPPDSGAGGIKSEDKLTMEVGNKVIAKLESLGHTVISCKPNSASTVNQSLGSRCEKANNNRVDFFVSIHFNAFNGQANGTEVFAISDAGKKVAQKVLDEIVKLGFFNRGVKSGSHLYVLKRTNMPGILIEGCFIDSAKDMQIYDGEAMANAIVAGLTGKVASTSVNPASNAPANPVIDEEQNKDKSILRLQQALNRLKITDKNNRPLVEDNGMGAATSSATEKFQRIVGVLPTGIASNTTWDAINQILAKRVIQGTHASGVIIRYLQYRIGANPDGIYGSQTEAALKKFQQQNGLTADGIIGAMTWQKLIG
ncbi:MULTISPECIES: N-acetylmuramoyl-L-alanine amidase [Nostocales]|jgi:N-acetylmuramoyl-L-alanine amidase|uniref:Cell wall hydrolase n=2 Tax=Aphanizomenonaceae TaxID=1892259 RepID=A0ACC7S736_DOLFA|nr:MULTISPECIES: N-acetylmuramoyl-L-alanine amidase [Nostocales]MBO1070519.1 cell wall hydrolase [Dolichospermum sp. DEX189]MCX5983864.1 N-acetylmuramoyl-L-alanine amidase [Nostocales cyanobacterium LacPavin_0920_SED1_MAG_38_18]ALB43177.1 cell wall hydrolase [Anabaena sp. WA102]MBD2278343.1 N-acetylmuramoyl-L-alanine amidase [Aphanizomenon flos-aquae FACHB-1040]MBO1064754.1 cell wall hydrolase [Anabaena sp. 54]